MLWISFWAKVSNRDSSAFASSGGPPQTSLQIALASLCAVNKSSLSISSRSFPSLCSIYMQAVEDLHWLRKFGDSQCIVQFGFPLNNIPKLPKIFSVSASGFRLKSFESKLSRASFSCKFMYQNDANKSVKLFRLSDVCGH